MYVCARTRVCVSVFDDAWMPRYGFQQSNAAA